MPWTTEQKIFVVEAYFRQKSIHAAQLQFKERFGCREFPVHSMIYRWVNKFKTHGTVHNLNREDTNRQSHSGRSKSWRTPHNVAAVRDSVVHSPSKSAAAKSGALNQPGVRTEYTVRTSCMGQQTPDYPWPEDSNHSSNKSDPKGGMREGHRELCPPDPKVPAAPGSSFEHIFWAPVKQRVFVVQTWNFGDVCYTGLT